jgi:hypothetical protein
VLAALSGPAGVKGPLSSQGFSCRTAGDHAVGGMDNLDARELCRVLLLEIDAPNDPACAAVFTYNPFTKSAIFTPRVSANRSELATMFSGGRETSKRSI